MSDEVRMIRAGVQAARDRRTVRGFNDDIGDAIEHDALAALDRLESQNQALQERIEKAREYVTENGAVMMNTPATWHGFVDEILNLLSPTQETDPE